MSTIFIPSFLPFLLQKIIPRVTRLSLSFSLLFLLLNRMQARGGEGWASEKDKESLKTGKGEERDKAMCFFTGGERRDR